MSLEPAIGFALVTYRDPDSIYRLLTTLNRVFGDPPISIHHDHRQSELRLENFGVNVQLLRSPSKTGWGTFQTTLAMASSIIHLMSRPDSPRWFYLITGHCYPLVTGDCARDFLDSSHFDLFMDETAFYPGDKSHPRYEEWCERYVYPSIRYPFPNRKGQLRTRSRIIAKSGQASPFGATFPCRAGSSYFTGTRAAAEALESGLRDRSLLRWFRSRQIVDEALCQTILGNAPHLRISNDNLRFIKWPDLRIEPDEEKPKTLTIADAGEISTSTAHFARKVLPGRSEELIRWIDRERLDQGSDFRPRSSIVLRGKRDA